MPKTPLKKIDEYLIKLPDADRKSLENLRSMIKKAAPELEEAITYGIPGFKYKGRPVLSFAAFKNHLGFYVMSTSVLNQFKEDLNDYTTQPGTVHFTNDKTLPQTLVTKLVKARLLENDEKGYEKGGGK